jgi:hypothetical protein
MYSIFNKISLYGLTIIAVMILFISGCENRLKKEPEYLSIITTMQIEDSTAFHERMKRDKMTGREYKTVKIDTAFIKKNISYYIIPFIEHAECVKEIQDLSNNDSSIIVITVKDNHNIYEAKYEISDLLKANRTNFPLNISDPIVIRGRLSNVKRN